MACCTACQTLHRGDLLFHLPAASNHITAVTQGIADHVAIALGGDSVLEAIPGKGVVVSRLSTVLRRESGSYVRGIVRNIDTERSIRNAATLSANYHHAWRRYALNVNLNARLQSKTYYPDYEDAPGYGVWNLHTTHSFDCTRWAFIEPSIGVDNLFNKVDRRIDSSNRIYALYSPGRMLVVGLKVRFKQ